MSAGKGRSGSRSSAAAPPPSAGSMPIPGCASSARARSGAGVSATSTASKSPEKTDPLQERSLWASCSLRRFAAAPLRSPRVCAACTSPPDSYGAATSEPPLDGSWRRILKFAGYPEVPDRHYPPAGEVPSPSGFTAIPGIRGSLEPHGRLNFFLCRSFLYRAGIAACQHALPEAGQDAREGLVYIHRCLPIIPAPARLHRAGSRCIGAGQDTR